MNVVVESHVLLVPHLPLLDRLLVTVHTELLTFSLAEVDRVRPSGGASKPALAGFRTDRNASSEDGGDHAHTRNQWAHDHPPKTKMPKSINKDRYTNSPARTWEALAAKAPREDISAISA